MKLTRLPHPVWTAIVRSDREAPARTTGGAASLGGVRSPWPWTVLAWTALLVAIIVSFRPALPGVWGDTPSFVESALRTLEAGRPTVAGGRDPGYPALLAVTFAFGGDLSIRACCCSGTFSPQAFSLRS